MTRIELTNGRMKVEVLGWDKIWALKSRLDISMENVVDVRRWDKEREGSLYKGIRAPGTYLPGVITAGTFHRKGEHVFYDVHNFANAVVIELKDGWYARLVVEVEHPEQALRLISEGMNVPVAA